MEKIFQPENQHLISYFTLKPHDSMNSVDMAILNSFLKSLKPKKPITTNTFDFDEKINQEKFRAKLKLCLKWNRHDMAQKFLFNEENKERAVYIKKYFN